MVNFLILLSLLITLPAQAMVVPSGVPQLQLGGPEGAHPTIVTSENNLYHATQNTGGYFMLHSGGSPGINNFNPFYRSGVAYQVPNGYTTVCRDISHSCNTANCSMQLVSDTSAIATNDTALTSGVFQYGASAQYGMRTITADKLYYRSFHYSFTSQTYPGYQAGTTSAYYQIELWCKEVAN